jgi:plastocyanin
MTAPGLVLVVALSAAGAADDGWGTLRGRVVFDGEPPAAPELSVTSDQGHCLAKGPLANETWMVNKSNKGVRNAFVWLASDDSGSGAKLPTHPSLAAAPKPAEVDQPNCAFVPRVVGLREGQTLIVKNSAPIAHNVRWEGSSLKNPGGNEVIPSGGAVTIGKLKADRFPVGISCSIHPWMRGTVRVFDHPYFAVTDADGGFEIRHAPAGNWRLFVWHEGSGWKGGAAGRKGEPITVKPGDRQDLGTLPIKPA